MKRLLTIVAVACSLVATAQNQQVLTGPKVTGVAGGLKATTLYLDATDTICTTDFPCLPGQVRMRRVGGDTTAYLYTGQRWKPLGGFPLPIPRSGVSGQVAKDAQQDSVAVVLNAANARKLDTPAAGRLAYTGWFDITKFGATPDYINSGDDDCPAIQRAINACAAAGGGTVYMPHGRYDLRDTLKLSKGGGQLYIPFVGADTSMFRIRFMGESPNNVAAEFATFLIRPTNGTVWRSWIKTNLEGAAMIAVDARPTLTGLFSYAYVDFENLTGVTRTDDTGAANSLCAFNMRNAVAATFDHVKATVSGDPATMVAPVNSFGIMMPHNGNKAVVRVGTVNIDCYATGFWVTEHNDIGRLNISTCIDAVRVEGIQANHQARIGMLSVEGCRNGIRIASNGGDNVEIGSYSSERATDQSKFYAFQWDVLVDVPAFDAAKIIIRSAEMYRASNHDTTFYSNSNRKVLPRQINGFDRDNSMYPVGLRAGNLALWNLWMGYRAFWTLDRPTTTIAIKDNSGRPGDRISLIVEQDATGNRSLLDGITGSGTALQIGTTPYSRTVLEWIYRGDVWVQINPPAAMPTQTLQSVTDNGFSTTNPLAVANDIRLGPIGFAKIIYGMNGTVRTYGVPLQLNDNSDQPTLIGNTNGSTPTVSYGQLQLGTASDANRPRIFANGNDVVVSAPAGNLEYRVGGTSIIYATPTNYFTGIPIVYNNQAGQPAAPGGGCTVYAAGNHLYVICAGESAPTLIH